MLRFIQSFIKWLLLILVLASLGLWFTGNSHVFKGVRHTYLKGRKGPSPDEFRSFAYRTVKAGKEIPWPVSGIYNKKPLNPAHLQLLKDNKSIAFLVIKNDSIVHETYFDGYADTSHTNSFSMAKTFVSILTGVAIQEGKIKSVDEPLGNYLPEFNSGKNRNITIKHLLTMSSGIDFDEDYVSPFAYPAKAYYGSDIRSLTLGYNASEEPGKVFKYLSGNTELLAMALEKATGQNISTYFSEKIWKPLGASQDAYWSLDSENGMEKAYCCLNSNARDFARLGSLYLHKGNFQGNQIVSASYVEESVKPAPLLDTDGNKQIRYGYSWWMFDQNNKHIYYARGILGQYVIVVPDDELIIVRLGHIRSDEKKGDHPVDVFTYLEAGLDLANVKEK